MTTPERSSSRIIHISDIHCTTKNYVYNVNWGAVVINLATGLPMGNVAKGELQDSRKKCQELVRFLTTSCHLLRTDKLVITGDIVDSVGGPNFSCNKGDFDALAHECLLSPLRDFGYEIIITPGNHDYFQMGNQFSTTSIALGRQCFFEKYSQYSRALACDGYPVEVDLGDGNRLILLDSLKGHLDAKTNSHKAQGNIGAQQTNWLRDMLPKYQQGREAGCKVAIALHHNPFERAGDLELADAAEFLNVIAHNVDALMFGHSGPCHQFYQDQAVALGVPVVTSEDITSMSSTGYPVSVIDMSCNQVEVYSTAGGLQATDAAPEFAYGSRNEAAILELAIR